MALLLSRVVRLVIEETFIHPFNTSIVERNLDTGQIRRYVIDDDRKSHRRHRSIPA